MKKLTWTIVFIFLVVAGPVTAQFYRYIDPDGYLRFTDDLNKIPAGQRDSIIRYQDLDAVSKSANREAVTEKETPPATSAESSASRMHGGVATAAGGAVSLEELRTRVEKMKGQLEAEYLTLAKEKDALAKARASIKTPEELAAYNESVDAFNQRAENYDKMSSQLAKLVEEYNASVFEEKPKNKKP